VSARCSELVLDLEAYQALALHQVAAPADSSAFLPLHGTASLSQFLNPSAFVLLVYCRYLGQLAYTKPGSEAVSHTRVSLFFPLIYP